MGKLRLLAAGLVFFGFSSIVSYLKGVSSPLLLMDIVTSHVFVGGFLIATGVGLWNLKPLALTSIKAIVLTVLIGGPLWLLVYGRMLLIGSFFTLMFVQVYFPALFGSTTKIFITAGISFAILAVICVLLLRFLWSHEVEELFPEETWFGETLTFGKLNGRIVVMAILFLLSMNVTSLTEKAWSRDMVARKMARDLKGAVQAIAELSQTSKKPEPPPKSERQQRFETSRADLQRRVTGCRFSPDENQLFLHGSDDSIQTVDLRTRLVTKNLAGNQSPAATIFSHNLREENVGPDGDTYYSGTDASVHRLSNPSFVVNLKPQNKVISFTSDPNDVVTFDESRRSVQLFNLATQEERLSVVIGEPTPSSYVEFFDSRNTAWVEMRYADKSYLYITGDGQLREVNLGLKYHDHSWVAPDGMWAVFSGPLPEDRQKTRTVLMTFPEITVRILGFTQPLLLADAQLKLYLTKNQPVKNLDPDRPGIDGPVFFPSPIMIQSLAPNKYLIAIENMSKQVTRFDLTSGKASPIGVEHDTTFSQDRLCFAVSKRKNLFAISLGRKLEVFWTSDLASEKPRTLVLDLDIAARP